MSNTKHYYFNFNHEVSLLPFTQNEDGRVFVEQQGQTFEFDDIQSLAQHYATARNVSPENLKNWTLVQDGDTYSYVMKAATGGNDDIHVEGVFQNPNDKLVFEQSPLFEDDEDEDEDDDNIESDYYDEDDHYYEDDEDDDYYDEDDDYDEEDDAPAYAYRLQSVSVVEDAIKEFLEERHVKDDVTSLFKAGVLAGRNTQQVTIINAHTGDYDVAQMTQSELDDYPTVRVLKGIYGGDLIVVFTV